MINGLAPVVFKKKPGVATMYTILFLILNWSNDTRFITFHNSAEKSDKHRYNQGNRLHLSFLLAKSVFLINMEHIASAAWIRHYFIHRKTLTVYFSGGLRKQEIYFCFSWWDPKIFLCTRMLYILTKVFLVCWCFSFPKKLNLSQKLKYWGRETKWEMGVVGDNKRGHHWHQTIYVVASKQELQQTLR